MVSEFALIPYVSELFVQVNGEKTNPVAMELTIRGESPYITDAIIFGAGRAQIGALIIPSELSADKSRIELLELIRPAIDLANIRAPSHSLLAMDHLIILPIDAPIPRADKGSFIRQKVYKRFQDEIEQLYQKMAGFVVTGDRKKLSSQDETILLVRGLVVRFASSRKIRISTDDQDLFDAGVDSLQSTRIRNAIQQVDDYL